MNSKRSIFPRTFENHDFDLLLQAFDAGQERLVKAVSGLDAKELSTHSRPGKWSVKDIIIHVADAEIMGAGRIRQVFAEPGCTLAGYEQAVWADVLDYSNQVNEAVQTSLALFEMLRRATSPLFHRARAQDWSKIGLHPEHGEVTLRNLLELYADHSERHIEQILEHRVLLQRPLDLQLLLKERLY